MSTFINDIAKIALVRLGYLPDYPYHLISNEELADAFFTTKSLPDSSELDTTYVNDSDMFHTVYYLPMTWAGLEEPYQLLHDTIRQIVFTWKQLQKGSVSTKEISVAGITYTIDAAELPEWIYSYMFSIVITETSPILDIHDLLVLLDKDNINDEFTLDAAQKCYEVSQKWVVRVVGGKRRPATIFGEPHVVKSLRLQQQGSYSAI